MQKAIEIIKRKPLLFLFISVVYLVGVGFLKWRLFPPVESIWYIVGGLLGVYFLDIAEVFFNLSPSPFRTIVFAAGFAAVSFFVVTSSGSLLAAGLVLSLYLSMILWQVGEWGVAGNLSRWYQMVAEPVARTTQRWILVGFVVLFLIETWIFVR